MLIDAVLFDIGGVLLTLGEADYRQQLAARLGLQRIPPSYEKNVPLLQTGELPEARYWEEIAGRPVDERLFDDIWLSHFRPIPAMWALAATLRRRGVRTGILSNTQHSHVRLMQGMSFLQDFNPVIMSCEVGLRKPSAEIFQLALRRLGLPAHRVAYVEDVPENIAAAAALGLRTILHTGDVEATRDRLYELMECASRT